MRSVAAFAVAVLAVLAVVSSASAAITTAPAFSTAQLAQRPGADWISTGGSSGNERYSTLNQITTGNVGTLKQAWSTHLDGSGMAGKYSAEATPLVYNGTMYVVTGNDDIFALDAATGTHLWTYKSNINQNIDTICCGWDARGVALGDGKVFVAQLDGNLVAVDQMTGGVVWTRPNVNWQEGYSQTASAAYFDGMVYTGMTGGEFGARGSMTAYDAYDGQAGLALLHVPAAGRFRRRHLGLRRVGDLRRHDLEQPVVRPGARDDVLLDLERRPVGRPSAGHEPVQLVVRRARRTTGQFRWYYQAVHHDLWDYDCPSPTMLFDVTTSDGVLHHALAEACKTGFLYIVDRATGKPIPTIDPMPEKKVPQLKANNTWATQPTPHGVFAAQCPVAKDWKGKKGPDGKPYTIGCIWTPSKFNNFTVRSPSAGGGNNWPPISYNPQLQYIYVCSSDTAMALKSVKNPFAGYQGGKTFIGISFGAFVTTGGTFTAMNATNNSIAWQKTFRPDTCYSGSLSTAGGLVFTGQGGPSFEKGLGKNATTGGTGNLVAYNAQTGEQLVALKTDAGANAPPMTYSVNGKQYVAIYAGGSSFNSTKSHGDLVYAYALP